MTVEELNRLLVTTLETVLAQVDGLNLVALAFIDRVESDTLTAEGLGAFREAVQAFRSQMVEMRRLCQEAALALAPPATPSVN
jgi:hypothetical protein